MKTLQLTERTGTDGILNVRVPLGTPDAAFDVIVVVQPRPESTNESAEALGWPPGYFENTFGSIDDETFVRPDQGVLPPPVEFE